MDTLVAGFLVFTGVYCFKQARTASVVVAVVNEFTLSLRRRVHQTLALKGGPNNRYSNLRGTKNNTKNTGDQEAK